MSSATGQPQPREKGSGLLKTFTRDIVAVASLGLLLLCVHELANPFVRGFQCEDETIRYPHKESTISSSLCYFGGSGLNILLVLILEYQMLMIEARAANPRSPQDAFQIRVYMRNVYCRLLVWFFGGISSELFTDISKVTAGRLRPHFISVCNPVIGQNATSLDDYCQLASNNYALKYHYITDYKCTGQSKRLRDIRLSFMSGHSSYSAYSASFAVFYIQYAMDVARYGLLKPALQVLLISLAFYTGLSRVSDYKHHWQDVLAGLLQGASVGAVFAIYLWPPVQKTYSKYITDQGVGDEQVDQELNRVSY